MDRPQPPFRHVPLQQRHPAQEELMLAVHSLPERLGEYGDALYAGRPAVPPRSSSRRRPAARRQDSLLQRPPAHHVRRMSSIMRWPCSAASGWAWGGGCKRGNKGQQQRAGEQQQQHIDGRGAHGSGAMQRGSQSNYWEPIERSRASRRACATYGMSEGWNSCASLPLPPPPLPARRARPAPAPS